MKGQSWYTQIQNYRWKLEPEEDRAVPGVPIKRNDDTADAERYMEEAASGFPTNTGPALSPTAINGKRLARYAV
jgi:hypothetical protein